MLSMLAMSPEADHPRQTLVPFQQTARVKSLALGCILVLALSGCGGNDSKPKAHTPAPPTGQPTGMLQGTLETVGGPAPAGKPKPVAGTVTITGADGSTTKAPVDESGKFAIGLYPGSYRVRGTSPLVDDGKTVCTTEQAKVDLVAGKTVTADVVCSIK